MSIEAVEEVIDQLDMVRRLAPKEPPVYTMLGRAYQRLGNNDEALKYYNFAIDLDPKEAVGLKVLVSSSSFFIIIAFLYVPM